MWLCFSLCFVAAFFFFPGLGAWDSSRACVGGSPQHAQLLRPPDLAAAALGGAPSVCRGRCGRDRSFTECGIQAHPTSASCLVVSVSLFFCSFSFIHTARFINSWSSKLAVGFEIQTPRQKPIAPLISLHPPNLTYFRNTLSESLPPRPSFSHCCERQAPLVDVC